MFAGRRGVPAQLRSHSSTGIKSSIASIPSADLGHSGCPLP
jgi:hypothetical protein